MINLIGKVFGRLTVVSRKNNDKWGPLCIAAWGEKTGICRKVIAYRLKAGWSVNKILTTPTGKYKSKQQ
jgi:hypothetical protein